MLRYLVSQEVYYNEPYDSCIVKQAVASGLININRYESYLRIMSDVLNDNNYEDILDDIKSR